MPEAGGNDDAMRFGRLIRERREARGWSQEALAAEAFSNSTRKGYVSQIEAGKIPNITRNTVRSIAEALNIDPEDIPETLRWPGARTTAPSGGNAIPFTEASRLFGRDEELADLKSAWSDKDLAIVALDAVGGVGKTALVKAFEQWLVKEGPSIGLHARFFWSFFSQGFDERRQVNGQEFLEEALVFFGYERSNAIKSFATGTAPSENDIRRRQKEMIRGKRDGQGEVVYSGLSDWNKGVELAKLVRERRTLLILDGLEPLQYPSAAGVTEEGGLRDLGMKALIQGLAQGSQGLTVITTRLRISELKQAENTPRVHRVALRPIPLMDAIVT